MFTYEQVQNLKELELSVYNFVIQHSDQVVNMKIRDLAREAHVSTTTILRFCSKMGCEGYSEFKVKLKLILKEQDQLLLTEDLPIIEDFFQKVKTSDYEKKLNKCTVKILQSTYIQFYGIGSSAILSQYGARFFSNLGLHASYASDPFYPVTVPEDQHSLAIILSVSGETEILVQQISNYRQRNFDVISITNSEQSTLAKLSDISLNYYMPLEVLPYRYNVTTQVPVIYLIETLGRRVQTINKTQNQDKK